MTASLHQQLLGHLLDALDDDERQWLEKRIEHDAERCELLLYWRRRLARLEVLRPDFDSPPGLAERTCRLIAVGASCLASEVPVKSGPPTPPLPALSGGRLQWGWSDVVVVGVILLVLFCLLPPAVCNARFLARCNICQNRLQHFGFSLQDVARRHQLQSQQLAEGGMLTGLGVLAARMLREIEPSSGDEGRFCCSEVWLAAQPHRSTSTLSPCGNLRPSRLVAIHEDESARATASGATVLVSDTPPPPSSEPPVLAHGGQGMNVLFGDGHVAFRPIAPPPVNAWQLFSVSTSVPTSEHIAAPAVLTSAP